MNSVSPSPILERQALLPRFALGRPVTLLMLLLSALVLGGIAQQRLALSLFPQGLDFPVLVIQVPYLNSEPQEVEQKICIPMEEILSSIKGLDRMETLAEDTGGRAVLFLKQDADLAVVYSDVKDRMERLLPDLPEDVERYFIFQFKADDFPIMVLGMVLDTDNPEKLTSLIERSVQPKLQRIDGLASITLRGTRKKRVLVEVLQDRLEAHGVDLSSLSLAIQQSNFNLSGGTVEQGGLDHYVRSTAERQSLSQLRRIPIQGTDLALDAVAEVSMSFPEEDSVTKVDGRATVVLEILKESQGNTVQICNDVLRVLEGLRDDPATAELEQLIFFNQGRGIESSLKNLTSSGLWGGAFAIMVLFCFLRRFQATFLIAAAIPLSLLVTVVILFFLGMNLNLGSMLGMIIGIGMLVDNSVVVVENIFRLRELGMEAREAALEGASEVATAITAATMTTVVVFLPLVFMAGSLGVWMREIGLPVAISVSASLLIALTLIPLASIYIPAPPKKDREQPGLVERLQGAYGRVLQISLKQPLQTFSLLLLVVGLTMSLAQSMKAADSVPSDRRRIFLRMNFDAARELEDAGRFVERVLAAIRPEREELEIQNIYVNYDRNRANLQFFLTPQRQKYNTEQVGKLMRPLLPEMPGVRLRLNFDREEDNSVEVLLQGQESKVLEQLVPEVERRLRQIPGLTDLETGLEEMEDEIALTVDRDRAWRQGLNPTTVATVVSLGLRGRKVGTFRTEEEEYDILLQFEESNRQSIHGLRNLPLPINRVGGTDGADQRLDPTTLNELLDPSLQDMSLSTEEMAEMVQFGDSGSAGGNKRVVPLATLAGFQTQRALREIHRVDGLASLVLRANSEEKDPEKLRPLLRQALQGLDLPRGYEYSLGRRFAEAEAEDEQANLSGLLAAVMVFLIMGALFESFVHPMTIILTLPFAYLGFIWMMVLTGTPVDLLASVGLVVLIGVVVNNSIVVVDRINQLRELGMERVAAILQAGQDRLRPILMTAMTTILGLVPMALDATYFQNALNEFLVSMGLTFLQLGSGTSSELLYSSLGRAVIGGLMAGTLTTMFLTPFFYILFDDLRLYFKRLFSSFLR